MKTKRIIIKKSVLLQAFYKNTKDWDISQFLVYRDLCNTMITILQGNHAGGIERLIEEQKGSLSYVIKYTN